MEMLGGKGRWGSSSATGYDFQFISRAGWTSLIKHIPWPTSNPEHIHKHTFCEFKDWSVHVFTHLDGPFFKYSTTVCTIAKLFLTMIIPFTCVKRSKLSHASLIAFVFTYTFSKLYEPVILFSAERAEIVRSENLQGYEGKHHLSIIVVVVVFNVSTKHTYSPGCCLSAMWMHRIETGHHKSVFLVHICIYSFWS